MSYYPGFKRANRKNRVDYDKSISGFYSMIKDENRIELKVDVDTPSPHQKALNMVSGTIEVKSGQKWSGNATAAYFRSYPGGASSYGGSNITADVQVTLSDGGIRDGTVSLVSTSGRPTLDVTVKIEQASFQYKGLDRKNKHYRDVMMDIDFVETIVWPVLNMSEYGRGAFAGTQLDLFKVMEHAGINLKFDIDTTQKVVDPTPDTSWTKADVFQVMEDSFRQKGYNDAYIWCLMATKPPTKQKMGYAIHTKDKTGFALFLKHSSFAGATSENPGNKKKAARRLLHYLAHECGACLGLDTIEGEPKSLSWMNYAWKHDNTYGAGSFYDSFQYTYSDKELAILRHQPDLVFKRAHEKEYGSRYQYSPATKSSAPDYDDSDSSDDGYSAKPAKRQKTRKVEFNIKFRSSPYQKGDIVDFQATMKNVGKLPSKIEPGFEPGAGNLSVYVTDPDGYVQKVKPMVRTIDPPTRKYVVLGKPGSREYSNTYSEVVPLSHSYDGPVFNKVGKYTVKAEYESYGKKMTSTSQYVTIEPDTDEDDAAKEQINTAATLENSSSYGKDGYAIKYYNKLISKPVEEKKNRVQMLVPLMQGYAADAVKVNREGGKKYLVTEKSPISYQKLIADTQDLVDYYHDNPDSDVLNYGKLVEARAEILVKDNKPQKVESEYAQLVADYVRIDADFDIIKRAVEKWKALLKKDTRTEKEKIQERFVKLFSWKPSGPIDNDDDASGLGLAGMFSNFDGDHKTRAAQFIKELERIEESTDDLDAVLDYAEARQQSFEVNYELYKWAIESYIVHSDLAKSQHISYPNPPKIPVEEKPEVAVKKYDRKGTPQESWLNYWRCDGDFNYHHEHWHSVYRGYRLGLKRQGELFVYIHAQLLARYDAERESWGLEPVKAYEYDEKPEGFHAGEEFHKDFPNFNPRPSGRAWSEWARSRFTAMEEKLRNLYETDDAKVEGTDGSFDLDPNVAGHIIEPTSGTFSEEYDHFHNSGHVEFAKGLGQTYMVSAETAARDPIFFRWHKKVDDVVQVFFDNSETELSNENPGVCVDPSDIVIVPGRQAPSGFDSWQGGKWAKSGFKSADIKTFLKEPQLKYEWDYKLHHEPFSYHIRLRRRQGTKGQINMTLRLFICPEKHVNDRRRWIEMDKFVHSMGEKEDHVVVKRYDVHATVIKRVPEEWAGADEIAFTTPISGNCECGWPYQMMLPRGTKDGENYCLAVFVSNNDVDQIHTATSCGSMSYCGTAGKEYPDQRTMGYPLSTPITIDNETVEISEAAAKLENFCIVPFKIVNDAGLDPPKPVGQLVWAPYSVFGKTGKGPYSNSRWTGRFRVVLDDEDFSKIGADRVRIRMKGRSGGSGNYTIRDCALALREGNSLRVDSRVNVKVTFNGRNEADVGEDGLLSDEIVLSVKTGPGRDYFFTFTLLNPGCYVFCKPGSPVSSYIITPRNLDDDTKTTDNWDSIAPSRIRAIACIYCIEAVVA